MIEGGRGPSHEKLEEHRTILRARGVPEAFIENLAGRGESIMAWGGGVVFIVPFIALLGATWLGIVLIVADSWRLADAGAARDGAWFAVVDGGVIGGLSLVLLIFAGICGSTWLFVCLAGSTRPFPAPNYSASILRTSGKNYVEMTDGMMRRAVSRAAGAATAEDFLRRFMAGQIRLWRTATLAILIPCGTAVILTHADYRTVGPSGVTLHSWWSTETIPWSAATKLELGCNSTKDDEDILYYVEFPNHRFDLSDDGGFNFNRPEMAPETALNAIEHIDALLPHVPRQRWSWLDRNPMAPRCLSYWFAVAGGDSQRILRLLRVD